MYLDEILQHKYFEVQACKQVKPLATLEKELRNASLPMSRDFKKAISGDSIQIIAEIKKASPSKGLLCPNFNPAALGETYEAAGSGAISVLTDTRFFQGALEYLTLVKATTKLIPILRKDFVVDAYQLIEAKLAGADAVLLIVAALEPVKLRTFITMTRSLGLAALVEVHDAVEVQIALEAGAEIIGINNRNLKTFDVNLETTYQLIRNIPSGIVTVSESGIKSRADIIGLGEIGVNAALIGETFVTANDPGMKIRELLGYAS